MPFSARIGGLKDSSGNLDYARGIAAIGGLKVFPSNEGTLLEARNEKKFAGCISATANLNAAFCARAFETGDGAALTKAIAIRALLDGTSLVAGVKAVSAHLHRDNALATMMPPSCRLPLSSGKTRSRATTSSPRLRRHDRQQPQRVPYGIGDGCSAAFACCCCCCGGSGLT